MGRAGEREGEQEVDDACVAISSVEPTLFPFPLPLFAAAAIVAAPSRLENDMDPLKPLPFVVDEDDVIVVVAGELERRADEGEDEG